MNTVNEMHDTNRTTISLSKETYEKLRRRGFAGQSLNDVLNKVLDQVEEETR